MHYLPGSLFVGAGAGLIQTGFIPRGTAALPVSDYATGTAVLNTARQLGGAVGVALFVALSGTATEAAQYASAWIVVGVFACSAAHGRRE